jgi:dTDP-4-amino-4,6-dideoxygalactose transaminase
MLRFRQHGAVVKYVHDIEGHNYRMEEIQGAVLGVKLKHLEKWTDARRAAARRYGELLKNVPEVHCPVEKPYAKHVYHLYVIRVPDRDELMKRLKEKGIDTGLHYPLPLHLQAAYKYLGYKKGDFPVAEKCCAEIVSLPMFPEMTEEQIQTVARAIREHYGK